jgi:hypothetical protein
LEVVVEYREKVGELPGRAQSALALMVLAANWPKQFPDRRITVARLLEHTDLGSDEANIRHALVSARKALRPFLGEAFRDAKVGRVAGFRLAETYDRLLDDWLYKEGYLLLKTATWNAFVTIFTEDAPATFWDTVVGIIESSAQALADRGKHVRGLALIEEWLTWASAESKPTIEPEDAWARLQADDFTTPERSFSTLLMSLAGIALANPESTSFTTFDQARFSFHLRCARVAVLLGAWRNEQELTNVQNAIGLARESQPVHPNVHDRLLLARLDIQDASCLYDQGAPPAAIQERLDRARSLSYGLFPSERAALQRIEATLDIDRAMGLDEGDRTRLVNASGESLASAFKLYQMGGNRRGMAATMLEFANPGVREYFADGPAARRRLVAALANTFFASGYASILGEKQAAAEALLRLMYLYSEYARLLALTEARPILAGMLLMAGEVRRQLVKDLHPRLLPWLRDVDAALAEVASAAGLTEKSVRRVLRARQKSQGPGHHVG